MRTIESELQKFSGLEESIRRQFPTFQRYGDHAFTLNEKDHGIDLWVSGLVHGNEVVGLEIINQFLQLLVDKKVQTSKAIAISLGNVPAAKIGKRMVDQDLNRSFSDVHNQAIESKRAVELKKLAAKTNVLIDLHQTIGPTLNAFFIFPGATANFNFLKELDLDLPCVVMPVAGFSADGKTLIEFTMQESPLRPSQLKPVAITIELGQMGFSDEQAKVGLSLVLKTLNKLETDSPAQNPVFEKQSYQITGVIKNGEDFELSPGILNFMDLKKNQVIGKSPQGELLCPFDAKALFPRYSEYRKSSTTLMELLTPLKNN